jgi:hypothetical protein
MNLTLTKEDIEKITTALGETPMKYAMPIFQILTQRIQEQQKEQQEQQQKERAK